MHGLEQRQLCLSISFHLRLDDGAHAAMTGLLVTVVLADCAETEFSRWTFDITCNFVALTQGQSCYGGEEGEVGAVHGWCMHRLASDGSLANTIDMQHASYGISHCLAMRSSSNSSWRKELHKQVFVVD